MGVLNITPDSFSDGGDFMDVETAMEHAERMVSEGASIIDVGGESTRPGAVEVDPAEEWARISPVVNALVQKGMCVSVDTRHVDVARSALDAGASIINDVSGFRDPSMIDVVKGYDCGVVIMHMKGDPDNMLENTDYDDVVLEVAEYLEERAEELERNGIDHDRICIDPGPGFGKTSQQSMELMLNIHEFVHLGYPVMVALSRKAFIGKAYRIDDPDPKARDAASAEQALMACELGASVVRTHNVALTAKALSDLRPYVLLGMGSNVALVADDGEEAEAKIAQINHAIGQLCQLPDTQIIDIAPFYESSPAYFEDQEDFINTVVLMRTGIPPKELLGYIHAIENSLGRIRERENGPRTIDIDILDYQMYVAGTEELTIPHPRLAERDFVVKPLADILPTHVLADGTDPFRIPEDDRVGRAWRHDQCF